MALAAIRWRTERWEPAVRQIHAQAGDDNVLQKYCDFLNFRYEASFAAGTDLGQEAALRSWFDTGCPGFRPEPEASPTGTGQQGRISKPSFQDRPVATGRPRPRSRQSVSEKVSEQRD